MVYVGIAIVLLLIIAPIIAILPSKRQKEQMAMRRMAMSAGLSVELTRIADPDPDPEKYLSNTGKPLARVMPAVAYRLSRRRPPNWRQVPQVDWCLVRREAANAPGLPPRWAWEEPYDERMSNELKEFFLQNLAGLPNDVVRVDEAKYVLSAYWNEHGGEQAVASIVEFLRGCSQVTPYVPPVDADDHFDRS